MLENEIKKEKSEEKEVSEVDGSRINVWNNLEQCGSNLNLKYPKLRLRSELYKTVFKSPTKTNKTGIDMLKQEPLLLQALGQQNRQKQDFSKPRRNKLFSIPRQQHSLINTYKKELLGARCGEIFVANNGQHWSFTCTFCNKNTRDIGEFVCHIKKRHLDKSNFTSDCHNDNDSDSNSDNSNEFYNKEEPEDYLDCSSYLDLNVHTEAEDPETEDNKDNEQRKEDEFDMHQKSRLYNKKTKLRVQHRKIGTKTSKKYQKNIKNENVVVNLLCEDGQVDNNDGEEQKITLEKRKKVSKQQEQNPSLLVTSPTNKTINATKASNENEDPLQHDNEEFGQFEIFGKPQIPKVDGTFNENVDDTDRDHFDEMQIVYNNHDDGYEDNENDEDFDNQLLIPTSERLDSLTGNEMKIKRRQIRGTAYCALCKKTFQYYSLYRNHMIKHSNETPFKCIVCKKGFKSKQAIRYHMHTHQKQKQYNCTLCDAGYYTENQFITHVLTHENDDTIYPCMVCGKILRSDKERDLHLTTHTEERPFRCEFCNKLFRLRHHLSNHLKMHRQYRCDYCKDEFTSAIQLRKPYACVNCLKKPNINLEWTSAHTNVETGNSGNTLQLFESAVIGAQQPKEDKKDYAMMSSDSEDSSSSSSSASSSLMQQNDSLLLTPSKSQQTKLSTSTVSSNFSKRYTCKYCEKSYSYLSGLNFHIRNKHS